MKSRKRSSSGKLGAKRALEKEAKILVPWSLDLDDDASSSDLEQGTKALNISAPANSLEEEGESNSEKSDGEMESKDTDEEDATVNADKESVTTSWVSNATLFPAEIVKENLAELSYVNGLPEPIAKLVQEKIESWFPVQKAVLPCLLQDIVHIPVIRPRDIAISAPTGLMRATCLADILATRWAPRKILLSATLSRDVEELHMWNLHQPRLFRADESKSKEIMENDWKRVLVFTNEKESSLRLSILISRLAKSKFTVEQLTGDLFGNRRAKVLKRFKNGTTRVLICSDVLSRGVDVEAVDCVVNYDLPKNDRLFVHRAGRTGRAGKSGHVLSLADGEARKIFVKNVLRKNGLWVNAEEIVVEKQTLEPHLHRYEKALAHLKRTIEEKKAANPSNDQALSYEYAECLAAQAFLRMAHLSYFVKQRPNAEFISPTGKVPLLKVRRTLIPEFSGIVDFVAKKGVKLCAHLSDAQVAEMRAHMSVMDVLLRNVEMYVMWKHNETYTQLTRYRYGSVYKWPLNWILPAMKRREILTKLHDSGWADRSTEEVLEQYEKALRALSSQLGSKPYLFGNQPTEADALLFGHLFTIITMSLPCMDLKNAILNYTNLQDFVTRVETEYFKI
ncbi:helicase protein [Ancylostoma ceylanicum]|uniref:Helicase protein n=1 Tax=Ancylostoma ceylanicum TaxID=53326 RepID=A0A0D6LJJ3_9BILA|nr:helicase protein [Ancylostoma ceylanicum]